jgi:hypothetical protein
MVGGGGGGGAEEVLERVVDAEELRDLLKGALGR